MPEELAQAHPERPRVLVVDDEPFIRNALKLYLETHDYEVTSCERGDEALEMFRDASQPTDAVLLDLVMPGIHGLEVLRQLKEEDPLVEVIIATGCGSMNSAIEALRMGAFDYITKPIVDFDKDLLTVVRKAVSRRAENTAKECTTAPNPGAKNDRYYDLLEDLAGSCGDASSDAERRTRLRQLQGFLSEQFAALGGVFVEHSSTSLVLRYGWGLFGGYDEQFIATATSGGAFWSPLLRSASNSWRTVSPGRSLPPSILGDRTEPLEVLRVPLRTADDSADESVSLLIFRCSGEGDATPRPLHLLRLVARNAVPQRVSSRVG